MGRDKALLPFGDATLLEHALGTARAVAEDVRILCGPESRYEDFGVPVILDPVCGVGPIGGLYAALVSAASAGCERVFWLGVDLPRVTAAFIRELVAGLEDADAALARTDRGLEPMSAAFRVTPTLATVRAALLANRLKLTSALEGLRVAAIEADAAMFTNVNTPDDYERALTRP